jgi:hypothetical protein
MADYYDNYDRERAKKLNRRKVVAKKAVDAGMMKSPPTSLARAFRESDKRELKIEKIHKEFNSMKDDIIELLPKTKVNADVISAILERMKKGENNITVEVSKA